MTTKINRITALLDKTNQQGNDITHSSKQSRTDNAAQQNNDMLIDGPDSALKYLLQQPGVCGYVVVNKQGLPMVYHGIDANEALQYSSLVSEYWLRTSNFIETQHTGLNIGQLAHIRVHTIKYEIIVASDTDYILVVLQKSVVSGKSDTNNEQSVVVPVETVKETGDNDDEIVEGDTEDM